MTRRRLLAIVGAVVLTLFGTVVLIAYVNSAERRAQQGAELVGILVADTEIAPGTPASDVAASIRRVEVPKSFRAEDAVASIDELGGKVTVDRILKGEPIVARQFGDRATAQRPGQGNVEEGHEIVTIALEPQRALGGLIAQGDRVGVIVSLDDTGTPADASSVEETTESTAGSGATTAMVLAGVRVAEVNGNDPESGETAATIMVSLDVAQSEAERVVFGSEFGRVWLTRQSENGPGVDDSAQTSDKFFKSLGSQSS